MLLDVYPAIWDKETVSSEPVRDWIVNGNLWDAHWAKAYGKLTLASHAPFAWMTMLYYPFRRMLSPAGKNVPEDPNGLYKGQGFVFVRFLLSLTYLQIKQSMSRCPSLYAKHDCRLL